MASLADDYDFEVKWRPYQLAPTISREGRNKREYYEEKFGAERVAKMIPYMQSVGAQVGINFSYGGWTGNTLDSHRLIEHAGKHGMQDEVIEEVFKAYFEDEKNLGDRAVLEDIMVRLNVPVGDFDDAASWLRSDELEDEVKSDVTTWQKKHRVNGVPHFVLNGKHGLSGAQEAETFVDLFKQL